ncbi:MULTISPECIES: MDR family MFS transporter [unclassified Streptomyces]|jgi:EmrB/QacA subfamily drug resistance transporter|uniref:MDR family MFS transporter n=1 Tax=unclassified Streptomyces TaxID=2593676 RepID=UPI000EF5FF91|nr:MDR family MFS transporter [Streptomyces sp. E5N91]
MQYELAESGTSSSSQQPRGLRVSLVALLIAMLLATLDNLILGAAMPTIVGELDGLDHLSWVVTAYALATAAATPIWGKLGDMYGRKAVFLAAIGVFLLGSALAGASQTMEQLIAFRAVQGLGAGGLMVGAFAIIGDIVPGRERGKYQGMMSAVMGLAMVAGPLAGGLITDHLGWRWCFYINLPLGGVAICMVIAVLRLPKKRAQARIDYLGAILLAASISSLVLMTTWGGGQYSWGSVQILGLGALVLVGGVLFVLVERRAAEPVLPLAVFRNSNFSLITAVGFLLGFVQLGALTFLPLFLQTVQGASATNSGFLLFPVFGSMMVVNVIAGRVTTQTGKYKIFLVVGSALVCLGPFLLAQMDTGTSRVTSGVFMAVLGLGMGLLMQSVMLVALESVEKKDLGVASSTATLSRTIGGSIGVAIMGALFTRQVQDSMAGRGPELSSAAGENMRLDAASLSRLPQDIRSAYESAVASGTHQAFLLGAAAALVAFAASCFVREVPLRGAEEQENSAAAPRGDQARVDEK